MLQKPPFIYKLAKPPTLHGSVERLYRVESLVPGLTRTRNTVDKLVSAVTTHAPQTAIALGVRDRPAF